MVSPTAEVHREDSLTETAEVLVGHRVNVRTTVRVAIVADRLFNVQAGPYAQCTCIGAAAGN